MFRSAICSVEVKFIEMQRPGGYLLMFLLILFIVTFKLNFLKEKK